MIVRNVLTDPRDLKMYRVKCSNPSFQRNLGRLKSSELLMHAIGFMGGLAETVERDSSLDKGIIVFTFFQIYSW
jgi:hypothetical protein